MKQKSKWIMTLIVSVVIFSCSKKQETPVEPEPEPEEEIAGAYRSNHGEVTGEPIRKTIGAEGGEITVPNSTLKLIVPPGAVDKDVNFSIQEVSYPAVENHADLMAKAGKTIAAGKSNISDGPPRSIASKVYRFLPEDVEFKKDVEIVLPYSENIDDKNMVFSHKSLRMVYQDKKGYWHMVKDAIASSLDWTVRVKTRHFSDWGALTDLFITNSGKQDLEKGESTVLELKFVPTAKDPNGNDDYLLEPPVNLEDIRVKEWRFWGTGREGTLSGGKSMAATYTAPASIGKKVLSIPIEVVVENSGTGGDISIRYWLYVLPEEYATFGWTSNSGHPVFLGDDGADVSGGDRIFINYRRRSSGLRLHIEAPDSHIGKKPFGEDVFVSMSFGSSDFYNASTYTACDSPELLYGKGEVFLFGEKNGLITGVIEGELRRKTPGSYYCYEAPKEFKAEFRYRKR